MQIIVLVLLISLATCLPVVDEGNLLSRTAVYVREVEVDESRHRTTRQAWISRQKKFSFDFIRQTVELDLELNSLIRDDVNMYVTENNVTRLVEIIKTNEEQYGYYQDIKTKASIMVKCNKVNCIPIGTFSVKGKRYRLDPNENVVESTHFVTEIRPRPEYTTMKGDTKSIFEDGSKLISGTSINEPHISAKGGDARNERRSRIRKEIPSDVDIIELYLCTDEAITVRFRDLYRDLNTALEMTRQYYSLICNEMDLEYQQVKNASSEGIDIRIYCKGIHVAVDSTGAPRSSNTEDSSGHVDASKALNEFSLWQRNFKISNNLTYDHAMAMSGKQFIGGTVGIAWLDTVCSSYDVFHASLVEDTPYYLALVATHELGHFLSAYHDPLNGDCSQNFFMHWTINTVDNTRARNPHTFSSCSISYFTSKLVSLGVNRCTRQHSFTDQEYTVYRSEPIGGEQLSLDQQCRVYFGAGSYACYKGNDMCHRGIRCLTSTGCNGRLYLVLDHSPCQEPSNKWCFRGLCVDKPTTTTTTQWLPTTTVRMPSTTTADTAIQPTTTGTTTARQPTTTVITIAIPATSIASTAARPAATTTHQAITTTYTTERPTTTTSPPSTTKSRTTVSGQVTSPSSSSTTIAVNTSLPATTTASSSTTSATDTVSPQSNTTSPVTTTIIATSPPITSLRSQTDVASPPNLTASSTNTPASATATKQTTKTTLKSPQQPYKS